MRQIAVALVIAFAAAPALAQPAPAPQQTPNEQALIAEMQAQQTGKLQCFARVIELDAELKKAQARIKEFEGDKAK